MREVEIYTQAGCPFCARALDVLKSKPVTIREIDAPKGSLERDEAIKRSGGAHTVPQIFYRNQALGGCSDLMKLNESGALDRLIAEK